MLEEHAVEHGEDDLLRGLGEAADALELTLELGRGAALPVGGPRAGNPEQHVGGHTEARGELGHSFTEGVWWDGDQALVEERTAEGTSDVSNNGVVGNIHGLTLDEPLAVMSDQTRIVNYNWRGLGESSVFTNGQAGDNSLGNPATEIDWPAATQAETYFTPGPGSGGSGNPKRWMGTFVANGQGTTGMLYRRNRYFSPSSGQFTQADPIGIAGGMNAFGFAGGDPVNYSDPFGLCPDPKDPICRFTVGGGRAPGLGFGAVLAGLGQAAESFWQEHKADIIQVGVLLFSHGMAEPPAGLIEEVPVGRTFDMKVRSTPGADRGTSKILIERAESGEAISRTHQVTSPEGELIHQHQEHIGKTGKVRSFPEAWREFKTIPPER